MKILLINSNPVVSRLTALSARKESVPLDEIRDIADLKNSNYNIVFVDAELLSQEILTLLKNSNIKRRVIFYTQDDKDNIDDIFNYTILKPFLPSEVSSILREAKMELDEEEHKDTQPKEEYLNLNELISTKKDDLEPLEIKEDKKYNILKGSEEELLKELKASKPITPKNSKKEDKLNLEDDLLIKNNKEEPISKNELFELDNKKDDSSELFSLDKGSSKDIKNGVLDLDSSDNIEFKEKQKSQKDTKIIDKDNVLDLDIESSNEVKFKEKKETPKDTKVLDKEEILNIKSLLDSQEPSDKNLSLDDVMTPTAPSIAMNIKKDKEIKSENNKKDKVMKKVFKDTVGSLPIEELRQLLRGTKIHITIEFPKEV